METSFSNEIGEEKAAVMLERRRLFTELNKSVGAGVAFYRVGENHPVVAIERKFKRFYEDIGVRHVFSRELEYLETAAALGKKLMIDKAGLVSEDMVSLSTELIREKIRKILGESGGHRFLFANSIVPREIISSIRSRIVSDLAEMFEKFPGAVNIMEPETVRAVAYSYEKAFREHADMVRPKVEDQFSKVKSTLLGKADTKLLPISRERIEKTLGEVVLTVSDVNSRLFNRIAGLYNFLTAEICVTMDSTDESMEIILMHEAIHALSGKTFLVDRQGRSGDIDRMGFRFGITGSKYHSKMVRFNWMNEGFTDTLCQELVGRDYSCYLSERALVEKLFGGMPDKGILVRAYFEDYDETKIGTGQVLGYWKQARAYLADRFGPLFLINLDDYIFYQAIKSRSLSKGAETAVREWDEMGDKFPAHVNSIVRSPEIFSYLMKIRNLRDADGLPVKKNRYSRESGHGRRAG